MAHIIRPRGDLRDADVTPRDIYMDRRRFLRLGAVAAGSIAGAGALAPVPALAGEKLAGVAANPRYVLMDEQTTYQDATSYNNFYEFGTGKEDPAENAHTLKPRPWSVAVEGQCDKPGTYAVEDLMQGMALEERIYRFRCVEAWSMVIPWVGFELGDLIRRFEPRAAAKFVEFETLLDPAQMPGQRYPVLDWPYREGLRIDEAMHPLALVAVGMYGEVLPNQNGAPLRLVLPWKYGFKSIKSIVKIRFRESQPRTSWNDAAPREYGFYSNVNPARPHPRWSQARERRIAGERSLLDSLFATRIDTLPFNGYGEQVAQLYSGMDLQQHF